MRIPSQLRQTSLYPGAGSETASGRDAPRGGMVAHWRRTFRLVLALVVVLVVMRRASDPSLYQVFFPSESVAFPIDARATATADAPLDRRLDSNKNATNRQADSSPSQVDGEDSSALELSEAMQTVVDGATWRAGDDRALQWMRRHAASIDAAGTRDVSVLALLQQPKSYTGKPVRVRGKVARCDSVQDYFQLWLKPADGSNRPIIAIVDRVPPRFEQLDADAQTLGPSVTVVARFLKRLAYRSAKGADVAPVVVGRIDRVPAEFLSDRNSGRAIPASQAVDHRAIVVLGTAGLLGVALAGVLVYRSSRQRKEMRARRQQHLGKNLDLPTGVLLALLLNMTFAGNGLCESVLPMLGKFDRDALESVFPIGEPTDSNGSGPSVGEMSKLVYQVSRLDAGTLLSAANDSDQSAKLGDAVRFDGEVVSRTSYQVPSSLVPYLEFTKFDSLVIQSQQDSSLSIVLAKDSPRGLGVGDRIHGAGVSVLGQGLDDGQLEARSALVAPRLEWSPGLVNSQGWMLLQESGFDFSLIDVIHKHDRQPLVPAEETAFFAMLAAADAANTGSRVPKRVPLIDLLRQSDSLAGDWVRLDAQAVRVTKIDVGAAIARVSPTLDADHYYQIDAIADLGNVVVKIEPSEPGGAPLELDGRYPIAIVTTNLPPELESMSSGSVGASERRRDIIVDAFFYRVWSYASDLSSRDPRSSDQLGPLLMATSVRVSPPLASDPVGVRRIGWIVCGVFIGGFLAILIWIQHTKRVDKRAARQKTPVQVIDLGD